MTCRQADEFLMRHVFGELSLGERVRFYFHLGICRACRRYLRTYRQTVLAGRASFREPDAPAAVELPEDLVRAILAAAAAAPPKRTE